MQPYQRSSTKEWIRPTGHENFITLLSKVLHESQETTLFLYPCTRPKPINSPLKRILERRFHPVDWPT
ncbi:hypothetical protein KIN20_005070 [Parelaphostrongylus tenuis]|uniref:Uncharacterized protein n=1 Tax=Parelaphostrongylus tenuis TaxID=148309 RepID=A0AAD5MHU4_PARTN|nr:hypothetical protein KIN20_005070 [Parelaphostrongylus tenuis]